MTTTHIPGSAAHQSTATTTQMCGHRTHVAEKHTDRATISDRATEVAEHLPPGPFTVSRFTDHATGLDLMSNASDAQPMIDHLTETGLILKLGPNIALWIAV